MKNLRSWDGKQPLVDLLRLGEERLQNIKAIYGSQALGSAAYQRPMWPRLGGQ